LGRANARSISGAQANSRSPNWLGRSPRAAPPVGRLNSTPARSALGLWSLVGTRPTASRGLAPAYAVEIETPVGEVAHGAFRARPREVGQIDLADSQGLDVLRRLRGYAVAGEREVAGRQDAALGVLGVHVGDVRQVADVAAHHDEALVLDRTRRAAIADPHIALAAVGAKRDENGPFPLVHDPSGEFGE